MPEPRTLHDLKNSRWAEPPYRGRTVRDEIRANLLARLESTEPLFPGIVGYEDTIIPQIINALLARHHFILLGLRGQAKSRILRELTSLLDEELPIVAGSEVNDDPFAPISKYAREHAGRMRRCDAHRLAAARSALRREARDTRRHDRRPHRRRRSDQGGAWRPLAVRRADDALRSAAARQSRHLRHQRAARSERQSPGGPLQHHAGRRRPDQRVSDPAPSRRAARVHREPRGLHRTREDHHATQGPDRLGGHHPLPPYRAVGYGDHGAGGVDGARRTGARHPGLPPRAGGACRLRGARGQAGGQAVGRQSAPSDQRARERRLECRAPRGDARRDRGSCRG